MIKSFEKLISITIFFLICFICSSAFSQEGRGGYEFDDIPGYTRMHTADWINDQLDIVSNQFDIVNEVITNLAGIVETNYMFMTNEFTNVWFKIENIQTNFDGSVSNIYQAISVESNRINNIETNLIPKIDERLDEHDVNISNLWINLTFVSNNVNTNYSLITNLDWIVNSNYSFTTNELTNLWLWTEGFQTNFDETISNVYFSINVESNRINNIETNLIPKIDERLDGQGQDITNIWIAVTNVSTNLDYLITNTIPEIVDNMGITVEGAQTAESDYQSFTNISKVRFDKESGFTVITNEMGEKAVQVSLGSAWTTLIPNIEQINPETGEPYPNLRPSGEETLAIKVVVTNETGTFWDYSNTNKNEKTFYIGIGQDVAGDIPYEKVYTTEKITVKDLAYPIGRYTNGTEIAENTSLKTIFANMFSRLVPPTYTRPELTINVTGINKNSRNICEYGLIVSPIMTSTYVQHDGGDVERYDYYINGTFDHSTETSSTTDEWNIGTLELVNNVNLQSTVYYGNGIVKTNSDGVLDPTGMIVAGNISKTYSVIPSKYIYYGTFSYPTEITSSNAVTSLANSTFVASSSSLTIPLVTGIKQTVFAVPTNVIVSEVYFDTPPLVHDKIIDSPNMHISDIDGVNWNAYTREQGGFTYKVYNYLSPVATVDSSSSINVTFIAPNTP